MKTEQSPDLTALLDAVLEAWNADRSARLRLVQLSERTSTALCELMAALRGAKAADAVPVFLSKQTLESTRTFVETSPKTEPYVRQVRTNNVLYYLEGDLAHLLKRTP